jgi:hypothetical protein
MAARAAEIEVELIGSFHLAPVFRLAAHEVAHNAAVLEGIDDYLSQHGLTDRRGKPRYLLEQRARTSRQLGYWLARLSPELERKRTAAHEEDTQPTVRERSPERLAGLLAIALESGMVDFTPEIEQSLAPELVKRGWTPPPPTQGPPAGTGEDEERQEDGSEPEEEPGETEDAGQTMESPSIQAHEVELPPGTVIARVPPTRPA